MTGIYLLTFSVDFMQDTVGRILLEIIWCEKMDLTAFKSISEQIDPTIFKTISEQIGLPESLQSTLSLTIEDNPWNLGLLKALVQNPDG